MYTETKLPQTVSNVNGSTTLANHGQRSARTELRKVLDACRSSGGDFALKIHITYGDPIMRLHGYRPQGGVWQILEHADMIPFNEAIMAGLCQEIGISKVSQVKQAGFDFNWQMTVSDAPSAAGIFAAGVDSNYRAQRYASFNQAVGVAA